MELQDKLFILNLKSLFKATNSQLHTTLFQPLYSITIQKISKIKKIDQMKAQFPVAISLLLSLMIFLQQILAQSPTFSNLNNRSNCTGSFNFRGLSLLGSTRIIASCLNNLFSIYDWEDRVDHFDQAGSGGLINSKAMAQVSFGSAEFIGDFEDALNTLVISSGLQMTLPSKNLSSQQADSNSDLVLVFGSGLQFGVDKHWEVIDSLAPANTLSALFKTDAHGGGPNIMLRGRAFDSTNFAATAGIDQYVRLWDRTVLQGTQIMSSLDQGSPVLALDVRQNSDFLVSGSETSQWVKKMDKAGSPLNEVLNFDSGQTKVTGLVYISKSAYLITRTYTGYLTCFLDSSTTLITQKTDDVVQSNDITQYISPIPSGQVFLISNNNFSLNKRFQFIKLENILCYYCPQGCLSCSSHSTSQCLQCAQGYYFQPGGSPPKGQCIQCSPSCGSCSGPSWNQCQGGSCSTGFTLVGNQCRRQCQVYETWQATDNSCLQNCNTACQSCAGFGFNDCLSCAQGYSTEFDIKSVAKGLCKKVCLSDQFYDAASNGCQQCHGDCASCDGQGFNNCLSCAQQNRVLVNKECRSSDSQGSELIEYLKSQVKGIVQFDVREIDKMQHVEKFRYSIVVQMRLIEDEVQNQIQWQTANNMLKDQKVKEIFTKQFESTFDLNVLNQQNRNQRTLQQNKSNTKTTPKTKNLEHLKQQQQTLHTDYTLDFTFKPKHLLISLQALTTQSQQNQQSTQKSLLSISIIKSNTSTLKIDALNYSLFNATLQLQESQKYQNQQQSLYFLVSHQAPSQYSFPFQKIVYDQDLINASKNSGKATSVGVSTLIGSNMAVSLALSGSSGSLFSAISLFQIIDLVEKLAVMVVQYGPLLENFVIGLEGLDELFYYEARDWEIQQDAVFQRNFRPNFKSHGYQQMVFNPQVFLSGFIVLISLLIYVVERMKARRLKRLQEGKFVKAVLIKRNLEGFFGNDQGNLRNLEGIERLVMDKEFEKMSYTQLEEMIKVQQQFYQKIVKILRTVYYLIANIFIVDVYFWATVHISQLNYLYLFFKPNNPEKILETLEFDFKPQLLLFSLISHAAFAILTFTMVQIVYVNISYHRHSHLYQPLQIQSPKTNQNQQREQQDELKDKNQNEQKDQQSDQQQEKEPQISNKVYPQPFPASQLPNSTQLNQKSHQFYSKNHTPNLPSNDPFISQISTENIKRQCFEQYNIVRLQSALLLPKLCLILLSIVTLQTSQKPQLVFCLVCLFVPCLLNLVAWWRSRYPKKVYVALFHLFTDLSLGAFLAVSFVMALRSNQGYLDEGLDKRFDLGLLVLIAAAIGFEVLILVIGLVQGLRQGLKQRLSQRKKRLRRKQLFNEISQEQLGFQAKLRKQKNMREVREMTQKRGNWENIGDTSSRLLSNRKEIEKSRRSFGFMKKTNKEIIQEIQQQMAKKNQLESDNVFSKVRYSQGNISNLSNLDKDSITDQSSPFNDQQSQVKNHHNFNHNSNPHDQDMLNSQNMDSSIRLQDSQLSKNNTGKLRRNLQINSSVLMSLSASTFKKDQISSRTIDKELQQRNQEERNQEERNQEQRNQEQRNQEQQYSKKGGLRKQIGKSKLNAVQSMSQRKVSNIPQMIRIKHTKTIYTKEQTIDLGKSKQDLQVYNYKRNDSGNIENPKKFENSNIFGTKCKQETDYLSSSVLSSNRSKKHVQYSKMSNLAEIAEVEPKLSFRNMKTVQASTQRQGLQSQRERKDSTAFMDKRKRQKRERGHKQERIKQLSKRTSQDFMQNQWESEQSQ